MSASGRWKNQEEAFNFAMSHPACMLDMDMGTGKTRVAIDVAFARNNCFRVLIVCPKAVVPVWRANLEKFAPSNEWTCFDEQKGPVAARAERLKIFLKTPALKQFIVLNYDSVWRSPMGEVVKGMNAQMVVLDESHRAKAAGSKVSKYLAMIGKRTHYKMCLSGTPMANSPLDVYGQYRFLDPTIFGTNHSKFMTEYAILGGPEKRFVIGYKNQKDLNNKFSSIAYTCKMSELKDQLKLPDLLPEEIRKVTLPASNYKIIKQLNRDFIAECSGGKIVVNNVLTKMIRLQQISAGFCPTVENPLEGLNVERMNTSKMGALKEYLQDVGDRHIVVFYLFHHDSADIADVAYTVKMGYYELSGKRNELEDWKEKGGILGVQIRAGAEGIDMTDSNHAVYYNLPHSFAVYQQSKARLYRPGQKRPVHFVHLIADGTIDEAIYKSLMNKKDVIASIKDGTFDAGFINGRGNR